jgi:hypothetical protein
MKGIHHNLNCSPDIATVAASRKITCSEDVARVGNDKCVKILVGRAEGKYWEELSLSERIILTL